MVQHQVALLQVELLLVVHRLVVLRRVELQVPVVRVESNPDQIMT